MWLCDGQKVTDCGYFKLKPLSEITKVGERVTVAARSIIGSSGAGFKPTIFGLQAIVVALNPYGFHEGVPKPSK